MTLARDARGGQRVEGHDRPATRRQTPIYSKRRHPPCVLLINSVMMITLMIMLTPSAACVKGSRQPWALTGGVREGKGLEGHDERDLEEEAVAPVLAAAHQTPAARQELVKLKAAAGFGWRGSGSGSGGGVWVGPGARLVGLGGWRR